MLEAAFKCQANSQVSLYPRVVLNYPQPKVHERFSNTERSLRVLSAMIPPLGAVGFRTYTTLFGDYVNQAILLFDFETMALKAIIGEDLLEPVRTGAASGVATKYLSNPGSKSVGIFGSGRTAGGQLRAIAKVRDISSVRVYSPNHTHAQSFAERASSDLGLDIVVCDNPSEVARKSEIIATGTNSQIPVFDSKEVSLGAHINKVSPHEVDPQIYTKARIFVDYIEQALNGRPQREPIFTLVKSGNIDPSSLVQLCDVVSGEIRGRLDPNDLTIYESCGMGMWDVAIASRIYDLALREGKGTEIHISDT
ncbi:MAG: ornithine cyclodeaminase family protein [Thaumarchaeota archaeon]|nr:ornithine cyclodeaminase family protein [Nitrososphaerota archaeon]